MGLNETPSSERVHIGFFGRRNAGKSTVVNAVTGQEMSVVSDIKGTTTDPVYKSMELLPIGPVVIIDTPGFDDEGALGEMRVRKTKQILNRADCAVLVVDGTLGKTEADEELLRIFGEKKIPYIVAYNKCDLTGEQDFSDGLSVSGEKGLFIHELKERIGAIVNTGDKDKRLVRDMLKPYDLVVLVIPIDSAAPKGRIILPQQQVMRDVLEAGAITVAVRDTELKETFKHLGKKPALVITDSQAFEQVNQDTPEDVLLTSFSILMARYKGFLEDAVKGSAALSGLKEGDKILISEGCTHHRQCDDIGTVKLPRWLKEFTGKELVIETSSGREFPEDISSYQLVIHCGGCMLNDREMEYRRKCAADAGVPFVNYGIAIAHMKGILKRSVKVFPDLEKILP